MHFGRGRDWSSNSTDTSSIAAAERSNATASGTWTSTWLATADRTVQVPKDLAEAMEEAGVREAFDSLSLTHRREHVEAVTGAKKPETRQRRIARAVAMLREGSKPS